MLWKWIKKFINKSDIAQVDIESEYNKIKLIKIWYDTNIIKLESNLNKIQKILEILIANPSNYNATVYQNIKYFFNWLISMVSSMLLDNYCYIISAQINANKKVDFINNLKLLITKENLITALIEQIGFLFKLNITNFCWKKFKNTYTYQALNYICTFPKKYYQFVCPDSTVFESNTTITKQQLRKIVQNYYEKFDINTKLLTTINTNLNDILNTEVTLDINEINNTKLPPLIMVLQKNRNKYFINTTI